jgi:ATP-dependent Clp protease, protease subunit
MEDQSNKEDKNIIEKELVEIRSLIVSGQVDSKLAEKIVKQLLVLDAQNHKPITLYIDSPGGSIDSGFAIFDTVRFLDSPVYTVVMGLAASMGAMILLSAPKHRRVGFANSRYLIHQPLIGNVRGVATEIEIHAQEMLKYRAKINLIIAEETGQPIEKVQQDTDRDFWLSADEAIQYGLIQQVVSTKKELAALQKS